MPRHLPRAITPAFRAEVSEELPSGQHSSAELCRDHLPSPSLLRARNDTTLSGLPFSSRAGLCNPEVAHCGVGATRTLSNAALDSRDRFSRGSRS